MSHSRPTSPGGFKAHVSRRVSGTRGGDAAAAISDDQPPSGIMLRREVLTSVPKLNVSVTELTAMPLDHRTGFILSFVDGEYTVEQILDACAMRREEALDILGELTARGIILVG